MSPPPPGSQGSAGPRRQTRLAGPRSPSSAAGLSSPQLRPSLHGLAPSARGSMAWGGGVPSRPPRRRGRASGTGTSASARAGGPAAGGPAAGGPAARGDRRLFSQRRAQPSSLGGAGSSAVCQAVAAASPDSPVGGGPRETAGRRSPCAGSSRQRAQQTDEAAAVRAWGPSPRWMLFKIYEQIMRI